MMRNYKNNEIGFTPIKKITGELIWGLHMGKDPGKDILLDQELYDNSDLVGVSIILAHEATHSLFQGEPVDQELIAYVVMVNFYKKLKQGIDIIKTKDKNKTPSQKTRFSEVDIIDKILAAYCKTLNEAFDKDELLDAVLKNDRNLITLPWLIKNINNYGGLRKRPVITRSYYIDFLIDEYIKLRKLFKSVFGTGLRLIIDLILTIMESANNIIEYRDIICSSNYENYWFIAKIFTKKDILPQQRNRYKFLRQKYKESDPFRFTDPNDKYIHMHNKNSVQNNSGSVLHFP